MDLAKSENKSIDYFVFYPDRHIIESKERLQSSKQKWVDPNDYSTRKQYLM